MPPPPLHDRHPSGRRRDQVVHVAPVALVFRIERVRRLRRCAGRLLFVVIERRGHRVLVALLDRVPARADKRRARDEPLDVGAFRAAAERSDPARVVRRPREAQRSGLDFRFEPSFGEHLEPVVVDVDVAIARVGAELHVGRIPDAALEPLRRPFDHRDVDGGVVRMRRVRIDGRLDAREIARRIEATHIAFELARAVGFTGANGVEVAHQRWRVFRETRDVEVAEAKRRPAVDIDDEVRAAVLGVDRRFGMRDLGGGIGTCLHRGDGLRLGRGPCRLPEGLALRKSPIAGELCDGVGPERSVGCGRARDGDLHGGDPRGFPGDDRELDDGRVRLAIDRYGNRGREEAFGSSRIARLVGRLAHQPVEELVGHLGVGLPPDEADVAHQNFLERRRCIDSDLVFDRRRRGRGTVGFRGRRVRHRVRFGRAGRSSA